MAKEARIFRHDEAARQLYKYRYRLGISALVLSAIVGASVFASLAQQIGPPIGTWITNSWAAETVTPQRAKMAEDTRSFKPIFEPENVEEVLRGWLLHAHKGRDRHDEAARELDKYRYRLGIFALVLSAIVGASVFASLATQIGPRIGPWITIGVGFLSIGSSALASLQTFYNYAERAENHRAIGARYKAIIRELEERSAKGVQAVEGRDRGDWLRELRSRLDALEQEAPVVPHWIYDRIQEKYSNVVFEDKADELNPRSTKDKAEKLNPPSTEAPKPPN